MTVSRETPTARTRHVSRGTRRRAAFVAVLSAGLLLVAACGAPPGPRGWAAALPAPTDAGEVILAPHKKTLFAVRPGTGDIAWRFPSQDKDDEPLSERARSGISTAAGDAGLEGEALASFEQRVGVATVGGDGLGSLFDAVDASPLSQDARDDLKRVIRDAANQERDAVKNVRALYGDIALSEDGDTAFVPTYGGWIHALDVATGNPRWIVDLDSDLIGGVAVNGETLYIGTRDGDVYSIDTEQGAAAKIRGLKGEIWAAPTFADDFLYITTLDGSLYKLDPSGEEVWRFGGARAGIAARPVVSNDRVYVGAFDNTLYAVSTETGAEIWALEADNWFWSEPVEHEGVLYAASLDGNVYAVDAETGDPQWTEPFDAGSPIRGALAVRGDAVIVGARDGFIHKLSLDSGEEISSSLQIGNTLESDLTSGEGPQVYAIPRDKVVWIIDAEDTPLSGERYILPD